MALSIVELQSPADRGRFLRLQQIYERELPPHLRHDPLVDASAEALLDARNRAFLAVEGAEAIGCIVLRHLDETTAVVQRLYVATTARRSGAGRALMEHLIAEARNAGYRRVVLDTDIEELRGAYRLYCSLGFTPCESFMPVSYESAHFMELPL